MLEQSAMIGPQIGRLLAVLNVLAIALYQAYTVAGDPSAGWRYLTDPASPFETFLVIAVIAFLPAMLFGAYLGWFAEKLTRRSFDRFLLVAVQALAFVIAAGLLAEWQSLIVPACASTVTFSLHLVYLTRPRHVLPMARVR